MPLKLPVVPATAARVVLPTVVPSIAPPVIATLLAACVDIVPSPRFVRIVAAVPSERLFETRKKSPAACVEELPRPRLDRAVAAFVSSERLFDPTIAPGMYAPIRTSGHMFDDMATTE